MHREKDMMDQTKADEIYEALKFVREAMRRILDTAQEEDGETTSKQADKFEKILDQIDDLRDDLEDELVY
jgi:hypothetical protein